MKILFVIHSLRSGGAERVLSLLANYWAKQNHSITIAANNTDSIFYNIDNSIKILNIGLQQQGFAKEITGNYKRIIKIKKTINEVDPDIVIGFMTTTNINLTIAAKLAKKAVVISERTSFNAMESAVWRFLRKIVYPFSNALIIQTSQDIKHYSFHPNVSVIENPLIIESKHSNIQREKIILAVGSLIPVKGFDMLLNAFSQLKNPGDWKLIILGEGKERESLENQIKQLRISKHVSLPGTVSDVEYQYKKASIFVLSSRLEGFPNVLCEAMAYGCPSIAFNCLTGPSDIIENRKNGLLIEAENVEALSKSIQELINDPKNRDYLSSNAVKISDRLDIEKISRKWFNVIEKLTQIK